MASGCCEFHRPTGSSSKVTPPLLLSCFIFFIWFHFSSCQIPGLWMLFFFFFNLSLPSSSLGPHSRNRLQNSGLKLLPCRMFQDPLPNQLLTCFTCWTPRPRPLCLAKEGSLAAIYFSLLLGFRAGVRCSVRSSAPVTFWLSTCELSSGTSSPEHVQAPHELSFLGPVPTSGARLPQTLHPNSSPSLISI